jgi:toxin ParE1/3/4
MQNKFKLSVKARAEIKKIFRYSFQQFGENQAVKYKADLDECFQLLADNPNMGRECNDIRDGYFRHEHESHIIFYTQRSNYIFITAIIHDRMNIKNILGIKRKP